MSKESKSTNSGDPEIDYKNLDKLRQYIGETGKLLPVSYTHLRAHET